MNYNRSVVVAVQMGSDIIPQCNGVNMVYTTVGDNSMYVQTVITPEVNLTFGSDVDCGVLIYVVMGTLKALSEGRGIFVKFRGFAPLNNLSFSIDYDGGEVHLSKQSLQDGFREEKF